MKKLNLIKELPDKSQTVMCQISNVKPHQEEKRLREMTDVLDKFANNIPHQYTGRWSFVEGEITSWYIVWVIESKINSL
jgi:hypothetical protein